MKNLFKIGIVALVLLALMGCQAHIHTVGAGSQTGMMEQQRQWYVLWGLVPINQVDTDTMSNGADDYTIKTAQSFLDIVINIFTGIVTVNSRTVTVER